MNTSQDATVMLRVLLLALLGILWSEFARAHAQNEATAPATQYVWTGVRDGVQRVKPGELAGYAAQLERDLAKLQVAREVDGPAVDLRGGLRELWVRAALVNEYPRRWDMLAKIAAARVAEFERRGELALARRAADELLLSSALRDELAAEKLVFELKTAPDELVRAATAAATPELVALRNRLDAQLRGASPGGRGSAQVVRSLEEAVERALRENGALMVLELGSRAAPVLEQLVRDDFDVLTSNFLLDPLVLLFQVDEARGAAFALDNWDRGGLLWRKRVLRAMEKAYVLTNPGTWLVELPANLSSTSTPPTLVDTGWRELLGRAVKDEDVGVDSFDQVANLARLDALDAPLQAGLVAQLERRGPQVAGVAQRIFEAGRARESMRPVLERILQHRDAELQVAAAAELVHYPRNAALLRAYSSPVRGVRAAVADSLVGPYARVGYGLSQERVATSGWSGGSSAEKRPPLEAGDSAMVEALLADSDARVRLQALIAALASPAVSLSVERLLVLARDPDVKVRGQLARWSRSDPIPAAVLEVLVADSERDVLAAAIGQLSVLVSHAPDGRRMENQDLRDPAAKRQWSDAYLPALVAQLSNPQSHQFGSQGEVIRFACRTAAGIQALIGAGAKLGGRAGVDIASSLARRANEPDPLTAWDAVAPEEVVAFARASWSSEFVGPFRNLTNTLPQRHREALRSVLLDAAAPSELRVICASASMATAEGAWRAALIDVLTRADGPQALGRLENLRLLDERERDALLHQLLDLRDVADDVVANTVAQLGRDGRALPGSLAVAVLERAAASDAHGWRLAGQSALQALSLSEAEPRTELLERLCLTPLCDDIVLRVGRERLAAHLPLLEKVLLGNLGPVGYDQLQVRRYAANALASYLDERAAAILLKGVGSTTDTNLRDACFAALESIRRYEDERERWATRKTSRAAREAAIAELVPMLADKDATIRAQAARSLGALEAVEHLPALVRLLKDSNGDVRKAAQSAIDALTAPKPVAPAPTEPKRD